MIDEKEFRRLKKRVELARQERDKAIGQLEAAMSRLEEEFGCTTIQEAEKKAAVLDKEAAAAERDFDLAAAEFEEAWNVYAAEQD